MKKQKEDEASRARKATDDASNTQAARDLDTFELSPATPEAFAKRVRGKREKK